MNKLNPPLNFFIIVITSLTFFSFYANEAYGIKYSYETPASKTLFEDEPYTIKLKIGDHIGWNNLEHVMLKMKIIDHHTNPISIKWSHPDGQEQVMVDNNEFVKGVTVSALNRGFFEFEFEIIPTFEMKLHSISVDVLEREQNIFKKLNQVESKIISEMSFDKESKSTQVLSQNNTELTSSKTQDQVTNHGISRNTNLFDIYKQGQRLIAEETFRILVSNKNIQNQDFGKNYNKQMDIVSLSRSEDPELQNSILKETLRAEELFHKLYHIHYNFQD